MKAAFGAGCFWGVQQVFDELPVKTIVGYMGGETKNPSYEQVSSGKTGHTEVVLVEYDPEEVSYKELLEVFFKIHDPTIMKKDQYKSVIFYYNEEQREQAEKLINNKMMTELRKAPEFYEAEDYHQKYYKNHPIS
ncbi:peptide-methionine (S)-S-oxide reductase MsrA [archaeon]|nr:peptide-methionine (S)-S-oxide reductase MsrA [archaeon]